MRPRGKQQLSIVFSKSYPFEVGGKKSLKKPKAGHAVKEKESRRGGWLKTHLIHLEKLGVT